MLTFSSIFRWLRLWTCLHRFDVRYDTDLSDEQWRLITPFIPPPKTGGRPCTTDFRAVVDGLLYLVKAGCPWRLLPKCFPPHQTVSRYFYAWRRRGVWKKIHHALYALARLQARRKPQPSALVIDSQSVPTGKVVPIASRGFDGGKKVKGRKRFVATDTLGLPVEVAVTRANLHDTHGGAKLLQRVAKRKKYRKSVKAVFADKGFQGPNFAKIVMALFTATVIISGSLAKAAKKFIPVAKRWVIERGFAWLGDYYRLTRDRERQPKNSVGMLRLSFIRILLRRLHPPLNPDWVTRLRDA